MDYCHAARSVAFVLVDTAVQVAPLSYYLLLVNPPQLFYGLCTGRLPLTYN